EGAFVINGVPAPAYFEDNPHWRRALTPFRVVDVEEASCDIQACVAGRAKRWSKRQPRALAHAIAGALTALHPSRYDLLWRAGFRFEVLSDPAWIQDLPLEDWLLLPRDELWARCHALFFDSVPREWAHNPHVVTFHDRWLLDVLLVSMDQDDLVAIREYLQEQGEAVSDVTILEDIFGITPQRDGFYRWRFTLSYRLGQAQHLGLEFVGSGGAWLWTLEGAPVERPEHHHRLPGTEGLAVEYIETEDVDADLDVDEAPVEESREEDPDDWEPTAQTWEHVLTYYDWDHGRLPYSREARQIIPPLRDGQRRAVLRFRAAQVTDEPFLVTLRAHPRGPWLHGNGLAELFVGYLVPGARIWIDRTEEAGLYVIRYHQTEPQRQRLLFFKDGRVRPVIEEREVSCEVDETMLLAEGRYSNIEALDRLDLVDRRTAPKVLARVFELEGVKDESRGVYCAHFDEVFPLLCVAKPYARSYVKNILYDRKRYPWFYSDDQRGPGWFVYDPCATRKVPTKPDQGSTGVPTVEVVQPTPTRDLWAELDDQRRRLLEQAVEAYRADPTREKVLLLRELAHHRIRTLLTEERLGALGLDTFNREIWRSGSFEYQGQEYQLGSEEVEDLFTRSSVESLRAAHESGALSIAGNQTWGSGSHEFGPGLSKTDSEKQHIVQGVLRFLLYSDGSVQSRMEQVITQPNGFGINTVSGILHAMHPNDHILYNRRSVEALENLGVDWPPGWRQDIGTYSVYRIFCHELRHQLGLSSLTDVDRFMYHLATDDQALLSERPLSEAELWDRYVLNLDRDGYIGWVVVHQRKLKGHYPIWARYLKLRDENPDVSDESARSITGIHWRGTAHGRYLGLITNDRRVTAAGRDFYSRPGARDALLHRQLQKWYYCVDRFCAPDPEYGVYPLFALLGIVLSFPESRYSISWDELRYFVLPTKKFGEIPDRVALIHSFRENTARWQTRLDAIFSHTYANRLEHMLE
ncbi:MAG: hypothetical protein ACOC6F_03925, partial [bacterium]